MTFSARYERHAVLRVDDCFVLPSRMVEGEVQAARQTTSEAPSARVAVVHVVDYWLNFTDVFELLFPQCTEGTAHHGQ